MYDWSRDCATGAAEEVLQHGGGHEGQDSRLHARAANEFNRARQGDYVTRTVSPISLVTVAHNVPVYNIALCNVLVMYLYNSSFFFYS